LGRQLARVLELGKFVLALRRSGEAPVQMQFRLVLEVVGVAPNAAALDDNGCAPKQALKRCPGLLRAFVAFNRQHQPEEHVFFPRAVLGGKHRNRGAEDDGRRVLRRTSRIVFRNVDE
jgi:hypothetical protein